MRVLPLATKPDATPALSRAPQVNRETSEPARRTLMSRHTSREQEVTPVSEEQRNYGVEPEPEGRVVDLDLARP
jgi:hypothetical protein